MRATTCPARAISTSSASPDSTAATRRDRFVFASCMFTRTSSMIARLANPGQCIPYPRRQRLGPDSRNAGGGRQHAGNGRDGRQRAIPTGRPTSTARVATSTSRVVRPWDAREPIGSTNVSQLGETDRDPGGVEPRAALAVAVHSPFVIRGSSRTRSFPATTTTASAQTVQRLNRTLISRGYESTGGDHCSRRRRPGRHLREGTGPRRH